MSSSASYTAAKCGFTVERNLGWAALPPSPIRICKRIPCEDLKYRLLSHKVMIQSFHALGS